MQLPPHLFASQVIVQYIVCASWKRAAWWAEFSLFIVFDVIYSHFVCLLSCISIPLHGARREFIPTVHEIERFCELLPKRRVSNKPHPRLDCAPDTQVHKREILVTSKRSLAQICGTL